MTSEEARQQAQTEGLTLLVADNKTGYLGVKLEPRSRSKPYQAKLRRGGKKVYLGSFATAEEAALCVARSPEGLAAAAKAAAAAVMPLTSEVARQQAQAEGLTLRVADNKAGYFRVHHHPGRPKPYQAQVWRGGKAVHLGYFATAEEAALSVARTPEGQAAAEPAAAAPAGTPPSLTGEEVERRAARSIRHKELLGRWEQVLVALAAHTPEDEGEAEAEAEAEAEEVEEGVEAAETETEAEKAEVKLEVVRVEVAVEEYCQNLWSSICK